MEENELLTFDDVMGILHIKKSTMYKIMASEYKIPFIYIGSRKVISSEKLYQWIHENEGRKIL